MKKEKIDLDKEVRNIGIALIILGVIHFVLSQFLDFTWGFVLVAVGIIALFYRSRKMLLTFGILLIVVGVLNLSTYAIALEEVSGFWGIFGIIQIIWGIQEINRFRRTRENPKYENKEKIKKGFVWSGLRAGFWTMLGFWLLNILWLSFIFNAESNAYFVFWLLWIASVIFTFVLSIIHLTKYKQKALAVTSLVFASFLILTAIVGLSQYRYNYEDYDYSQNLTDEETQEIIDYVDSFCSISCQGLEDVYTYDYQYDEELDEIICYCLDSNYETILQKIVPYPFE
jgi:DMSO/TMAO reductase YedYZ heme-binding membrane subunit